jgi:hypothetical protein
MDVIEVIDGAFKDFQQMWADIGYTEEDQIKEVNEFVGSITKLCTDKVERLKEEKEQMMLDVTHSIDQIKKLAKQLDDGEVEIVLPFARILQDCLHPHLLGVPGCRTRRAPLAHVARPTARSYSIFARGTQRFLSGGVKILK